MTPITVSMDQLANWGINAYVFLHVLFGILVHYHSVSEVRTYNKSHSSGHRISSFKMLVLFIGRMTFGFPWFIVSRVIAPVGNKLHWTPVQINEW